MNMKKLTLIIGIDDHFNGMAWQLTYARPTISIHNHFDSIQSQFIYPECVNLNPNQRNLGPIFYELSGY